MKKQGYSKAESEYSPIHKLLKDKPTEVSFYKKINNFPVVFDIHLEPVFLMNQIGRLEALYPQKLLDRLTNKFLDEKRQPTNGCLLTSSHGVPRKHWPWRILFFYPPTFSLAPKFLKGLIHFVVQLGLL